MSRIAAVPRASHGLVPRIASVLGRKRLPVPVAELSTEAEEDRRIYARAIELRQQDRLDLWLDHLQGQLTERDTTPMGIRHSELFFSALYAELYANYHDSAAAEAAAVAFWDWYDRAGDDPDVGAIVARALQILTEIESGDDADVRPNETAPKTGKSRLAEAAAILEDASSTGLSRELWHRTRFRGALLDCDDTEERRERFERFVAFDPCNVVTYFERAHQLLPRWQGGHEEIERFARQSAERTGHRLGAALYTMIYMSVAESLPMDQSNADWLLVLDGFEDALEILPPVPVINDFLRLMARFGRDDMVRDLFDEVPEIRLDRWDDANEPQDVHAWAQGEAPWPYGPDGKRAPG